jgi:hypothetical protein
MVFTEKINIALRAERVKLPDATNEIANPLSLETFVLPLRNPG